MKTRMIPGFVLAALAALALASCAQKKSFTDASGSEVKLDSPAARVVSLSPALTEILFAAGAGPKVAGVTKYCNYPAEALALPKVAEFSPDTVSLEAIVALKPDLVVGERKVHERLAEKFKSAGVPLLVLDLDDIDDVYAAIGRLADLSGTKATGDRVVSDMKARVSAVAEKIGKLSDADKPVVFYEVWDEPLMTAGPATVIGQVIVAAGGRNCFADVTQDYPPVSSEQLVSRNPAFILSAITHAAKVDPAELVKRPGWEAIDAVKNRKIFTLDDDVVSRPGPRLAELVEMVAAILHPDLFPAATK